MIPWANFENGPRNNVPGDVRMQLHEYWLPWIEHGPSMTTLFFQTPMLEVAHERQFVVCQQGGDSANFELEHTRRMEECLKQLGDHFHNFASDESFRLASPCGLDLMYCWKPNISFDTNVPLYLSSSDTMNIDYLDSTSTCVTGSRSATSRNFPTQTISIPTPEVDSDEEISDTTAEQFKQSILSVPRASTTLPIHGARAKKIVRQRKRFDSKLATGPLLAGTKRSSAWMVDEHEDDAAAAMRSQTISQLRPVCNRNITGKLCERTYQPEGT